jgi:GFO/IDH/MocA oxidoreductase family protein
MFSPTIRPPTAPTLPLPFRGHRTNPVRPATPKTAIGGDHPAKVRPVTQRRLPPPRTPDPMAAPPLRWGVLAPGWIAGQFAAALRRGTRQEIVAAGSRSFDRARAFAEEHGAPTAYGSYDELVHDPQVDIVYIASPHSEHHRQARLALKAGKARPGGEGIHPQPHRGPRPHQSRTRPRPVPARRHVEPVPAPL